VPLGSIHHRLWCRTKRSIDDLLEDSPCNCNEPISSSQAAMDTLAPGKIVMVRRILSQSARAVADVMGD
jgi:hypothetical protein